MKPNSRLLDEAMETVAALREYGIIDESRLKEYELFYAPAGQGLQRSRGRRLRTNTRQVRVGIQEKWLSS